MKVKPPEKEHIPVWKTRGENLESWVPTWKRTRRHIEIRGEKFTYIITVWKETRQCILRGNFQFNVTTCERTR